jgi:hypothetical protein
MNDTIQDAFKLAAFSDTHVMSFQRSFVRNPAQTIQYFSQLDLLDMLHGMYWVTLQLENIALQAEQCKQLNLPLADTTQSQPLNQWV